MAIAIPRALENITGGVVQEYENAVQSSQPENLFKAVLLACAFVNKDSLGRFAAIDLRDPLKRILKRDYRTVAYQGHLAKFREPKRGAVLKRTGTRKRYRWQFTNPQLIPYVQLQGIKEGLLKDYDWELTVHLALAALLAISDRSSLLNFSTVTLPLRHTLSSHA